METYISVDGGSTEHAQLLGKSTFKQGRGDLKQIGQTRSYIFEHHCRKVESKNNGKGEDKHLRQICYKDMLNCRKLLARLQISVQAQTGLDGNLDSSATVSKVMEELFLATTCSSSLEDNKHLISSITPESDKGWFCCCLVLPRQLLTGQVNTNHYFLHQIWRDPCWVAVIFSNRIGFLCFFFLQKFHLTKPKPKPSLFFFQ